MSDVVAIDLIIRTVAEAAGVTPRDIRSRRRDQPAVKARHAAMWLARQHSLCSYPAIGRAFGDRDDTTIMYGVSRTDWRMAKDSGFAAWLLALDAAWQGR